MYNGLLHAHSGFRWIVLVLLVVAVLKSLIKWRSNAPYTEGDRKLNLFTMLATHIQFTVGVILYFISPKVQFVGSVMKEAALRFFTVEHTLMMLIAIALITVGHSKSKKASGDAQKSRSVFIYYLLALLVILVSIPWPFRELLGAGWF